MTKVLTYWVREFDLDGFRCDVALAVPTDYWEQAREALDKVKPDLMMLAEAHKPELLAEAFDLDYSWPLHKALTRVMTQGLSAKALRGAWEEERTEYPRGALHMRISDDHDEERAIAVFGTRGALAASAFMFTLDGVPLLYNGMEVGDTAESGDPALFERVPILWQMAKRRPEFPLFYRQMIALRRGHAALRQGETEWLTSADNERVVAYLRRGGGEEFLVAINLSNRPFFGQIEVGGRRWREVTPDLTGPGKPAGKTRVRQAVLPLIALDAWGFRIFQRGERAGRPERGRRAERRRSGTP
jgi:glycosidase